ncbi:MAG: glycoside hydrolase, partial [Deltaproteobacteria bacterium]|nr:glycoside hydrolase [Deltaproteobacteria bacterium]
MHQPLYKDPLTGEYLMPWALLHGTKDYYDMAAILDEFPEVHQTFNLVPSLIEQLNDYAAGRATDTYRSLSLKPAQKLTRADKAFLLKNFFQANWDNMIRPVGRYWELLRKRGASNEPDAIETALRYFSGQEYLDLQTLFNLVWIDPEIIRRDRFLTDLLLKGKSYTEAEKTGLLDKQIEIIKMILPKYRELYDKGIVELTTSPYYHPIMPLLNDSDSAKVAMPYAAMPRERFLHPEDAAAQLKKGMALFEAAFGRRPKGLWPPEGSVSFEVLPMIREEGIDWIASDEEILANTLRKPVRRDPAGHCHDPLIYKPYTVPAGDGQLAVFFRDHVISDRIGFDYAKMRPEDSADELVARLMHIRGLVNDPSDHIVPIILDGENAWENYRNDGRDFLVALYSKLSRHPHLQCVTFSEFMANGGLKGQERLQWLYPGSWINHNFKVWIGHAEDNTAWDYISAARDALVK